MEGLVVKLVETEEERQGAFDLRMRVFVEEQGVPAEEELDEDDVAATHAIAVLGGQVVGAGRVVYPSSPDESPPTSGEPGHQAKLHGLTGAKAARIGRMAVERAWRRRGIGGRILTTLEDEARRQGMTEATLHAQTYVKALYAAHGYAEEGEVLLEAGIEHVSMRKRL